MSYHLEMIKDRERVQQICAALDEVLEPTSIHGELGAGTGIFAIYAAQRCAKVYAVERDPEVFALAQKNIAASGLAHKIELTLGDALKFQPPERLDSLLAEMLSVWCVHEPQVPVLNDARRRMLKPNGRTIPAAVTNLVELGEYDFSALGVACPAVIPQFTGITAPRIKTVSVPVGRYDFSEEVPMEHTIDHPLTLLAGGRVNCARLSSIVELSPTVSFFSTDSLMPQTLVPLAPVAGRRGDTLHFRAAWTCRTSLESSTFSVWLA